MTRIFTDEHTFYNREDKTENGVSKEFAEQNPNWEEENKYNKGCWNCSDCSRCSRCSRCSHIAYVRLKENINPASAAENPVRGFPDIPIIENIHQKVYEAVSKPGALNMDTWHTRDPAPWSTRIQSVPVEGLNAKVSMRNSEVKRPVLRYHGGKFILAKWIISHFPDHSNYVEAFGGAGSVLLQKARSKSEVYNDLWDCVVNVFRVLRDPVLAAQLEKALILTPYSRTEFLDTYEDARADDPVERARKTILRSFGGFGSAAVSREYRTGFRANHRSNGTNCAIDWMGFPDNIQSFVERLRGVVIENRPYNEIIEQQDSPGTLFYLDPPYVHDTRNIDRKNGTYFFEMTDQDHIEMAKVAHQVRGMVVISGYDCDLYKDLFSDWRMVSKETLADGARPRTECLWINPAAAAQGNKMLF